MLGSAYQPDDGSHLMTHTGSYEGRFENPDQGVLTLKRWSDTIHQVLVQFLCKESAAIDYIPKIKCNKQHKITIFDYLSSARLDLGRLKNNLLQLPCAMEFNFYNQLLDEQPDESAGAFPVDRIWEMHTE